MNKILSKQDIVSLLDTVQTKQKLSSDFIYDVYEVAFKSIDSLETQKILKLGQPINSLHLFYYVIGEYTYSLRDRTMEEIEEFNKNEQIKISMASVCADKYMSSDVFKFKPETLGNKYLPPISSLDVYTNFMVNLLDKLPRNNPDETLIVDLLSKSASSLRCILKLLCDGFDTEAMATWRTLHESECILILLDKYGDNIIKRYLKHMSFAIAYRGGIKNSDVTDRIFVDIKAGMKENNLKSKDMKKYIEYGWLFEIKEFKEPEYKLNFRDGLEKIANLGDYSRIYEQSSEIIHSTPMFIYSSNVYYYMMTLIATYESFFRIEKIFSNYCFKGQFKAIQNQYEQMKTVYYNQLQTIYKKEVARFKEITKSK